MSFHPQSLAVRTPAGPFPLLLALLLAVGCLTAVLPAVAVAAEAAPVAIGPYDAAVVYPAGSLAIGPDGNTYRASKEVKGVDPTQANADSWHLAHVSNEVILDVPGRFKTIAEAMAFLAGCRIAEPAKAVVLVAPGKLDHEAPLVLNHAEGARIVIRGAGEKPEECVLLFEGDDADEQDGLVVNNGHVMTLDNLTIESTTRTGRGIGLLIDTRAAVTLNSCNFNDFTCVLGGNSHLSASNCAFQMSRPGDAVHVRNGSEAVLDDCRLLAKPGAEGVGCAAYNGGTLFCVGCRAEGWGDGFKAYGNSVMHLERCVGRDNGIGASVWHSSSLNALDCVFAKNKQVGVAAIFATAGISGCQLTDNGAGAWAIGNAYLQFLGKPSTISGCSVGIEAKAGGRVDLIGKPVYKNVPTPLSVGNRSGDLPVDQAFINAP